MSTCERKPVGKRLRFDTFKRDGFICQYCGAHPPQVVLEVDHMVPVSAGGTNDPDNLITACFNCNRGKAAIGLDVVPQSLADKAAEIAEREDQLLGYNAILQAKRERLEDQTWEVIEHLLRVTETSRSNYASVRKFVERLGLHECMDAADIALASPASRHGLFKYFCGVCWNKIRDAGL